MRLELQRLVGTETDSGSSMMFLGRCEDMHQFSHFLLLVLAISLNNEVVYGRALTHRPMENPNLFEGDISGFDPYDRTAIGFNYNVWSNAVVYYKLAPSIDNRAKNAIFRAMTEYREKTCITFKERLHNEPDFVYIFPGNGCYSFPGMKGGMQELSLGAGCIYHGTILHELGHAIGFFHEHSRPDRDDFITVHDENIGDEFKSQFAKIRAPFIRLLTQFDSDSLMMYGGKTFTKNNNFTMTSKDGRHLIEVYEKTGFTDSDILRVKKLYRC